MEYPDFIGRLNYGTIHYEVSSDKKSFTKEFKLEAVRLLKEGAKPASEITLELGIRLNQLYKWQEMFDKTGDVASSKLGRSKKKSVRRS